MKEEEDNTSNILTDNFSEDSQNESKENFSLFEGEIEQSTLRYDRQGQALLTISGWLLCVETPMIALQFAIPGSELSLARRTERPGKLIDFPDRQDSFYCGFVAVLTFKERSMILDDVHFIATLSHGLTVAGALSLPETFIQNSADQFFPEPGRNRDQSHDASWGPRMDREEEVPSEYTNSKTLAKAETKAEAKANRKELLKEISQINAVHRLKSFLSLENRISFEQEGKPIVSIIIVLHNKAEYTLDCLQSLSQSNYKKFNLIIIDNDSTDDTHELLDRIDGATVIRNKENLHFVKSINQNLNLCTGQYTLLLNNDAQITPGAIEHAVNAFSKDKLIGAVGGRVIRADGLLQEAGCSILSNGGCYGYGVGQNPWDPKYLFTREVDFCSGTFLMLKTEVFNAAGGFDPRYEPAYFEEVDLQIMLSKAGYKVIFDPKIVVFHAEHGSSSTLEASKLQIEQRKLFCKIHKNTLPMYPNTVEAVLRAGRSQFDKRRRILVIDDDIPMDTLGTGLPRTKSILESLNELNFDVTYYPIKKTDLPWYKIQSVLAEKTEIISNSGEENLLKFLIERQTFYDFIWISRPHNLEVWNRALKGRGLKVMGKIIYDAESLFAERELDKLILSEGKVLNKDQRKFVEKEEQKLFADFSKVVLVSNRDKDKLTSTSENQLHVLSIPLEVRKDTAEFEDRSNIVFVGPLTDPSSANVHGVKWFIDSALPLLASRLPNDAKILFVGANYPELLEQYSNNKQIEFLGPIADLTPIYNNAKVVIVPTHYSAGISLKALYGASNGVPLVATTRIANELGWSIGEDILCSDSPFNFANHVSNLYEDKDLWIKIRDSSQKRISNEYSKLNFTTNLKKILS